MRLPWSRKQKQTQEEPEIHFAPPETPAEQEIVRDGETTTLTVAEKPRRQATAKPTGKRFAWGPWEQWLRDNYPGKGAAQCAAELSAQAGRQIDPRNLSKLEERVAP